MICECNGARTANARFARLWPLVGNTPLLAIRLRFRGRPRTVYAKAENHNMTGSIKDRMALQILRNAYAAGAIRPGDRIAEATSGNTGISFAAIGRALGHPVTIFMPDWMSPERVQIIKSFGADVVLVSSAQGGFRGSIHMSEELAASRPGVFLPRQFANAANVAAHEETTGPELWLQMETLGSRPDAFVAGVGTGGTVMGVGRYLRGRCAGVRIYPLEPAESPTLSTGRKMGRHRLQGISDEFIPPIVDLADLAPPVAVHDGDAILMAQMLARCLGLGVGLSSGANLLGALVVQDELGPDARVATVFADDNKKYLSTALMCEEPVRPEYLSPSVELLSFEAVNRVCETCRDPGQCTEGVAILAARP